MTNYKKYPCKKRCTKKRISKKRISKKRISKKRISKKRISKKRLRNKSFRKTLYKQSGGWWKKISANELQEISPISIKIIQSFFNSWSGGPFINLFLKHILNVKNEIIGLLKLYNKGNNKYSKSLKKQHKTLEFIRFNNNYVSKENELQILLNDILSLQYKFHYLFSIAFFSKFLDTSNFNNSRSKENFNAFNKYEEYLFLSYNTDIMGNQLPEMNNRERAIYLVKEIYKTIPKVTFNQTDIEFITKFKEEVESLSIELNPIHPGDWIENVSWWTDNYATESDNILYNAESIHKVNIVGDIIHMKGDKLQEFNQSLIDSRKKAIDTFNKHGFGDKVMQSLYKPPDEEGLYEGGPMYRKQLNDIYERWNH